jgi:predicted DNA-binding transcriptional regulator AlpA
MTRAKPAQPEVIRGIVSRIDKLLKLGVVTKDFVVNSEEASAITGLSEETVRRYARCHHFPHFAYPGRNMYPLKEICKWVESKYQPVLKNASEINGYKPRKRKGETK